MPDENTNDDSDISVEVTADTGTSEADDSDAVIEAADAHSERARDAEGRSNDAANESSESAESAETSADLASNAAIEAVEASVRTEVSNEQLSRKLEQLPDEIAAAIVRAQAQAAEIQSGNGSDYTAETEVDESETNPDNDEHPNKDHWFFRDWRNFFGG